MRNFIIAIIILIIAGGFNPVYSYIPPDMEKEIREAKDKGKQANYRSDCAPATAEIDLDVNNVRARLMTGGDMWWDLDGNARYIVPNVRAPQPEVSALFSGAVWIGGYDEQDNLKLAGQTFRGPDENEWWPGPLTPGTGETFAERCRDWDRFFRVTSEDIREHRRNVNEYIERGLDYPPELIPDNIKYWPALGNPFFNERYDFELPDSDVGLGTFFDYQQNFIYDPSQGDFPTLEIRGCDAQIENFNQRVPDEMYFWVYNDAGGPHTNSLADPMRMEVQVQAFAYSTQDEINNMTFYRHKMINRAPTLIDSTFFAMWVDPDLGCAWDDYIGCDTSLDLMYVYNEDAVDGRFPGSCECDNTPTYCTNIPALGVDYFRGPIDWETGEEIGMSSFVYHNNSTEPTGDPQNGTEFYRYLTGHWRDGTPVTEGGDGYNPGGGTPTRYVFPDSPDDLNGWSMCSAGLEFQDRRTIQASGPFSLIPGQINELIIGVVWVPDIVYPCPDLTRLLDADRTAQALFDNCFIFPEGPDAPDLCPIELDKEIIFTMINDTLNSNNKFLQYAEKGLRIPDDEPDSLYVYEGYQVFQLKNSSTEATSSSFEDVELARLVFQTDVRNDVSTLYNWNSIDDPNSSEFIWVPNRMVDGRNQGVRHSFRVTEDLFADGDRSLINHKKYYYAVIAYAYNEYEQFDSRNPEIGQEEPYLAGNGNVMRYTVVPRPTVYKNLNADYGDGVPITRLSGFGTGRNFLDLEEEIRLAIVDGTWDGELSYEEGSGPIDVQIYNPLDVVDGEYELVFFDDDPENDDLSPGAGWVVTHLGTGEQVYSETSIETLNETLAGKFGFSVTIGQVPAVGTQPFVIEDNGFIGGVVDYEDPAGPEWLEFVPDLPPGEFGSSFLDYIKTEQDNVDFELDPNRSFVQNNESGMYPYCLIDGTPDDEQPLLTPAWVNTQNPNACVDGFGIDQLSNVDIVFTSDKSKWSRSVIVQTSSVTYDATGLNFSGAEQFELLDRPAASKEAGADGLPLEDPELENGFGWFPGYAIDVETGKRLNIFFGENTIYSEGIGDAFGIEERYLNGNDRMWNPGDELFVDSIFLAIGEPAAWYAGGQHFIYVTGQEYDGCEAIHTTLASNSPFKLRQLTRLIQWAGMPLASELLSYDEGLIPNDVSIKLRVTKAYETSERGEDGEKGYNRYQFTIDGKQADDLVEAEHDNALDQILVVPNPYYAYSTYEETSFDNRVKITNVPDECTVTIYSLDGKFIKRYERNTGRMQKNIRFPSTQGTLPSSAIEWDLRNSANIPVSSGVYLIHIEAPGLGERVIKWFGVSRQFDPAGL